MRGLPGRNRKTPKRITESAPANAVERISIPSSPLAFPQIKLSEAGKKTGKLWEVVIIQAGWSKNGRFYPKEVLSEAARLFEDSQVFIHRFSGEEFNHLPDQVRDGFPAGVAGNLVGWIDKVHIGEANGSPALLGDMHIEAPWLQSLLLNFHEDGKPNALGLSIDVEGQVRSGEADGQQGKVVESIDRVYAVDVVTFPAAGGGLHRLKASQKNKKGVGNTMKFREQMLKFVKSFAPAALSGVSDPSKMTETMVSAAMIDAVSTVLSKAKEAGDGLKEALTEALGLLREGKLEEGTAKVQSILEAMGEEMSEYREKQGSDDADAGAAAAAAKAKADADAAAAGAGADAAKAKEAELAQKAKTLEEKEAKLDAAIARAEEATKKGEAYAHEKAIEKSSATLESKMTEAKLAGPAKELIREQFKGSVAEPEAMDKAISRVKDVFAKMVESGGFGTPASGSDVSVGATGMERIAAGLDLALGYVPGDDEKKKYEGIRPIGLREAYTRITGDHEVRWGSRSMPKKMREAATSDFPLILGDSVTRKLNQEYKGYPQNWKKICEVTPLKDFRTQRREQLSFFADLSTVTEDDAYTAIATPTEYEATYAPAKRGNLFSITREMVLGDDLRKFRRIPTMIARSAWRTLEKFAFNLLTGNVGGGGINTDTIYDSAVLYHASHSNLATDALAADALTAAMVQMALQQDPDSRETLGLAAKWLIVPVELGPTAQVLVKSELKPGTANNDVNPNFQAVEVIAVPYLSSDTDNWYLAADPRELAGIEIGFVNGQENPEVLVQDDPAVGDAFSRDRITYKVRHEYGGAITDYRPLQGNIV